MKKLLFSFTLGLFLITSSISAQAMTLLSEDFTGVTIQNNLPINLLDNPANTSNDNLGVWIDYPNTDRWGINTDDPTDPFAQMLPQTSDGTYILYYAMDIKALAAGSTYSLSFDYASTNRNATVILGGMYNGLNSFETAAPWFEPGSNDGELFLGNAVGETYLGGTNLARTNISVDGGWSDAFFTGVIAEPYDVMVLGFIMGGTDGLRGVDNIELSATAPVPEPSTMLLLGGGLVGLICFRKKIKK